jgi:malonate-semialdehyde dehydrogenase (acetylating)/methylmalonate-semialdehyde dehydrogenase
MREEKETGMRKLQYWVDGGWKTSKTTKYMDCYNASSGEVMARAPQCTVEEVEAAIASSVAAYPAWSDTPPNKRVQVLFRMKSLMDEHLDELTLLCAKENGKILNEAMGDVLKVTEVIEFACGIPHLMKGPALMNCTRGYDTTQYKESVGVFAGIFLP